MQKDNKVKNLLTKLRRSGKIINGGSRTSPVWKLAERNFKKKCVLQKVLQKDNPIFEAIFVKNPELKLQKGMSVLQKDNPILEIRSKPVMFLE